MIVLWAALLSAVAVVLTQGLLSPPYFDIGKGKNISATATCGEDYSPPPTHPKDKKNPGELYCALAELHGKFGIRGLSCSYCVSGDYGNDPNGEDAKDHNIRNANDGSNRWWQSPPLSRGLQYRKVNITIDLGQSFHVAYVIIKSANSPRPGVWALERSNDGGKTYHAWHYFAPTSAECRENFGVDSYLPIVRDDTVICSTEYSQIPPFQDGEIHLSLINGRPGASNFSYSKTLQAWTSATNIRLRFLDIKTLLTDLLPLSLEDPTVTNRYYYSIKDISIGGRCMCNGFADECQPGKIVGKYSCRCQYNTEGERCSRCLPGYVQHKWRPRSPGDKNFQCEKCNCHGHSDECEYDEQAEQKKLSLDIHGKYNGGGVCKNCLHNTHGVNCEKCKPFFYRPRGRKITDRNACQPCNCDTRFSTGLCAVETGQCECKKNYAGRYCNRCNKGYHSFPRCSPCECNINGSIEGECGRDDDIGCRCKRGFTGSTCDRCRPGYFGFPNCTACDCLTRFGALDNNCERDKGQCRCKRGYSGRECERCGNGFYQFPYCKDCGCDPRTTKEEVCEAGTGECVCKDNFDGARCDRCASGYYAHPSCYACDCSTAGSESAVCDVRIGKCRCKPNYEGFKCDRCAPGYYGYPTCARCSCNTVGSRSTNCDSQTGQCSCFSLFSGRSCDRCLPGFYGFPNCQRCNCNPAGTVTVGGRPGDCSTNNNGQCVCKANVRGLECNECKAGYFTLTERNQDGCKDCECYQAGTTSGILNCKTNGQCSCKLNVKGTRCRDCRDGYYSLQQRNVFGCAGCDCDSGGAMDTTCSKSTGQCKCYPNLTGRRCNVLKPGYYFRDLHHIKVEMEEGFTPDGDAVRFDYQESKFPGYTWKGFVFINEKQPVAIVGIDVPGSCSGVGAAQYEIVFRYVLNQIQSIGGKVTVYRRGESTQEGVVNFVSTQKGNSVSSSYEKVISSNGRRRYFRLIPGKWNIKIEVPDSRLLLDHLILLPREYTEALYLSKRVENACEVKTTEPFCNLYQYLSLARFQTIEAETTRPSRSNKKVQLFNDTSVLDKLDFKSMVLLSPKYKQQDIMFRAKRPGKYVAVLPYYHDSDNTKFIDIFVRSREDSQRGKAWLYTCRYTFGCRSAVLDRQSREVAIFNIKNTDIHLLSLISRDKATVAIDSIILIDYEEWNLDYATPKHYCVTKFGKCTLADYRIPADSKVVRPIAVEDEKRPPYLIDPNVKVKYFDGRTNVVRVNDIRAGNYHIVVHYYQPNHPSFEIGVGVYSGTGSGLSGRLNLAYCPHLNGCREKFQRSASDSVFVFEEGTSKLRFDIPRGKDTWIEYVLFIPEGSPYMNSELFQTLPMGLPKTFRQQCSGNHFNIRHDSSKFCKESVQSLTTGCNKGPASCNCNTKGSISSQCRRFDGQCPCRENVIGRTCTRCKIGFYGFPNCKACNCSNCDDVTGRCTCAPGVMGEKCDRCKPGTFGYDPVIGCQPCNCDGVGTGTNSAICNVADGQCPCLKSFGSRKCSVCAPGYYGYPGCRKCNCFVPGLTKERCDRYGGRCFCQENVVGEKCSECRSGFFKTRNPKPKKLCNKCWCNGRALSCEEAKLYRKYIKSPNGLWKMSTEQISSTAIIVNQFSRREFSYNAGSRYHRVNLNNYNAKFKSEAPQIVYWVAPREFLGNQLKSYGGKLTYNFGYSIKRGFFPQAINGIADIIIHADGVTLHAIKRFTRIPGKVQNVSVLLNEDQWTNDGLSTVSRDLFLTALSNIRSIHIRATHDEHTSISTLTNVTMESGDEVGTQRIHRIEKCNCRWGYTGLSCTECAAGFTRQKDGTCGPCQCSGRSRSCDPEDGTCTNCTGNTDGEQCEKCQRGYYGDKCKPCECPSANPNNNFADSCSIAITTGSLVCRCKPGYAGRRCEKCDDGYHGNPVIKGGFCKKCLCSGNIDTKLTGNCDQKTGRCYKCVKNTFGPQCEMCRPGYYGDAVVKKNCKDCKCNLCGSMTLPCDRKSGQCQCKKNVVGTQCNKCKPNTWNFRACKGCEDCNCGMASLSKSCDQSTGQCQCKPTVMGKRCDWCKLGYYGYTTDGCKKCACPNGRYCDVKTGNCDCGVNGEECTLCPMGHIIENGKCVECDSCVQNTLKRVNVLVSNITKIKDINIPGGVISHGSLDDVNRTLIWLTKESYRFETKLEKLKEVIGFGKYGSIECKIKVTTKVIIENEKLNPLLNKPTRPSPTVVVTRVLKVPKVVTESSSVNTGPTPTMTTDSVVIDTTTTSTDFFEDFTTTEEPDFAAADIPRPVKSSVVERSRRAPSDGDKPCPVSKILESTKKRNDKVNKKVSKLEKDAYEAKAKAKATKRRAKDTLDRLKKIQKKLDSILNFANSSLGSLSGGSADDEAALKRAKEILEELRARDFGLEKQNAKKEKDSALNATIIADGLKKKGDEIESKVSKFSFKNLVEAFRNLKKSSKATKDDADKAVKLVNKAKDIDYKSIVDIAVNIHTRSGYTIEEAKRIIKEADDALTKGKEAYKIFNNKKEPLAILIVKLKAYLKDLGKDLEAARPDVDKSVEHASNLTDLADRLRAGLGPTKQYAKMSIYAAYRYKLIVNGIYEALEAAKIANETAYIAKTKAEAAKEVVVESKRKSIVIKKRAETLIEKKEGIKLSLESVRKRIQELKNLREKIQGRVDEVKEDVKIFEKEKVIGEKARNISEGAKAAIDIAEDGNKLAKKVKENVVIDKEIVINLATDIGDINKRIKEADQKVKNVKKQIPPLEEAIDVVKRRHEDIQKILDNNVTNSLEYIKFLIANSRDIADRTKLATKFDSKSQVILDPPKDVYESSINSRLSLIFKHNNGNNAMLLFMGNGSNPDGVGNAYLGFDINNKKVRFHFKANAESGDELTIPEEIKKEKWYKVTATRNFKSYALRMAEIDDTVHPVKYINAVNETTPNLGVLPIQTFGKDSDVFVGSIPTGRKEPKAFATDPLDGCLDKLTYNHEAMGLWDWKEAKEVGGCQRRGRTTDSGVYCFKGNGFVDYNATGLSFSRMELRFRTRDDNGLLILAVDPPKDSSAPETATYYALELNKGFLVSKYNIGGGDKEIDHSDLGKVNDGTEHLFKIRFRNGRVKVTFDKIVKKKEVATYDKNTHTKFLVKKVYIGGVPMKEFYPSTVNMKGFVGCLKSKTMIDSPGKGAAKIVNAFSYIQPRTTMADYSMIGHSASFPTEESYLEVPACSLAMKGSAEFASFGFSFQTHAKEGTLVIAPKLVITLEDGQINLTVTLNDGTLQTMVSKNPTSLADGKWHTVTLVNRLGSKLILGTDRTHASFESGKLKNALDFSGPKNMNIGGGSGVNGFNGNIREVFCLADEIDLRSGSMQKGAQVGSIKMVAPLPLVAPKPPTPTTSAPVTTTAAKIVTTLPVKQITDAPVTTQVPVTTQPPPVTTQPPPVTTQPPPVTTQPPPVTTQPPPVTTQPPPVTTQPPVVTTQPTTTQPPVVTTQRPTTTTTTTTTAPPTTTTSAPTTVVTTQRPTTQPPPTTTQPPVTTVLLTTQPPPETTQPAPETTQPPPITTKPPPETTQPVPETTQPKVVTTTAPPVTDAPTTTEFVGELKVKTTTPQPCQKANIKVNPDGYGFGLSDESYTEFSIKKGTLDKQSEYEFYFYTMEADGILLTANMKSQYDYESIYLDNGKIAYTFNAGSGSGLITTKENYNDGKWHKVLTRRSKVEGTLIVDDGTPLSGQSKGGASSVNNIETLYVGGAPTAAMLPKKLPKASNTPLKGGIRNIKSMGEALVPAVKKGVSDAYEDGLVKTNGVYVGDDGGYIEIPSTREIGTNYAIELDVRAGQKAGYLFYAAGAKDGLTLIIQPDGKVKAECNNGGGLFSVEVMPSKSICDGELHRLSLVKKGKTLKLKVDEESNTVTTTKASTAANTGKSPLYFGGIPVTKRPSDYAVFTGCISNVKLNKKTADLSVATLGGGAMRGCGG